MRVSSKISEKPYSYQEYTKEVEELFEKGVATGSVQNEQKLSATKINISRIKRLNKTYKVSSELEAIVNDLPVMKWIVFSEGWCGDSAQCVPLINKIAEINPSIGLKIVLRDENMNFMNQYLTNGSAAIPKLVAFDKEGNEVFTWGARPTRIQQMVADYKSKYTLEDKDEFNKNLHFWYAKDKGESLEVDFIERLSNL
ncbi:MAG: thioredoxin family protein [Flavobacteriales bacterium]|nr:thioredoxin family protein [Flavobacteriales bacterium]